jgi:hypothetical protein
MPQLVTFSQRNRRQKTIAREKKVPYIVSLTDFGATTFLIPANINHSIFLDAL